jgi:molybdopterin synthase sulfur carrier subunit
VTGRTVRILYFAWIRDRIGLPEEELALPAEVRTAGDLIAWLARRDERYAEAFRAPETIRVALDQTHVTHEESLEGAREIALFPPMTGG